MRETKRAMALLLLYTALALATGCGDDLQRDPPRDGGVPSCVSNNYTAQPTYNGVRLVPDDGDKVCATRANPGDGPVNPGIKGALDNAAYGHSGVFGVHQLPSFLSSDGATLVYGGVPAITFDSVVMQLPADTIDAATVLGAPLANNTWYYTYTYLSGNTVRFVISTQGPDQYLRYRDGNTSRGYLGCFRTDGSGVIIPFSSSSGRYVYAAPRAWEVGGGPTSLRMASLSAVGTTTVAFTGFVPPFAKTARIVYNLSGDLTTTVTLAGVTASGWDSGTGKTVLWEHSGAVGPAYVDGDFAVALPTGAGSSVNFIVSARASGGVGFGVSEFTY